MVQITSLIVIDLKNLSKLAHKRKNWSDFIAGQRKQPKLRDGIILLAECTKQINSNKETVFFSQRYSYQI